MSDRRRRKSLSIFTPEVSPLTRIDEPSGRALTGGLPKKRLPATFFTPSASSSPTGSDMLPPSPSTPIKRTDSRSSLNRLLPKARPRSLQKSGRPSSILGSLRNSLHSSQEDDGGLIVRTTSNPASINATDTSVNGNLGGTVLHHGEVQTAGGVFRKKSQYFVLTETHLVRFKSQNAASEVFPCIPSSLGRSAMRHSRMSSSGSLHELHTVSSGEVQHGIPLNNVISVWRLEDGKPYFSIEINHLSEETNFAGSTTLQLDDFTDCQLWMSSIRGAVIKACLADPQPFSQSLVEYTARALEQERDYDPNNFHMFKVIRRPRKSGPRSSSEDLTKVTSTVCILAIGVYKVHLVPLPVPRSSRTVSNTSLSDMRGICHGLMSLTCLDVHEFDDAFLLKFRLPLRQTCTLCLASSLVSDIALTVRHAADFLRPQWAEAPFTWNVPKGLNDEIWDIPPSGEDNLGFDRTLTAYCAAYDLDTSKIRYAVHDDCDDAPGLELLPPIGRTKYSPLELLAIMRSLRYNESFASLSFRDISLDDLHGLRDDHGHDHVPFTTKSGQEMNIADQEDATLLVQEVRALAVKSRRLRRLDFSYCLTRTSQKDSIHDSGCGICEALFPLCERQWTNVDWIILNGIVLTDIDIDYLFAAAIDKSCHFRALDVGYCGLVDRSMSTILQAISHQGGTMESIDLSGNLVRLQPYDIANNLRPFEFIRKLSLVNISKTSGPEPLIPAELLCSWKLTELRLSGTPLNEDTVDALAAYLISGQSDHLRFLELDRCRLTSRDAATFLVSMHRGPEQPRQMHIQLNENRLEEHHDALVDAISRSRTPCHVTMQMIEYRNERNFRKFLDAFAFNTTTVSLDISKATLPDDVCDETSDALYRLFAENNVLEELDISGEHSHLESANYGTGLNRALLGLKRNHSLKVLRVEYQRLGLQGASTLASVLEENCALREIYCENNEINLQAFTVLVGSLEKHNNTLLWLPAMDSDRAWTQKKVDREMDNIREIPSSTTMSGMSATVAGISSSTKATVNRTLGRTIGRTRGMPKSSPRGFEGNPPTHGLTEADFKAAIDSLSENWEREISKLQRYLARNYNLAHGLSPDGQASSGIERPSTSDSVATAVASIDRDDRTPTAELNHKLVLEKEVDELEATDEGNGEVTDEIDDAEGALEMSEHFRTCDDHFTRLALGRSNADE